MTNNHVGMSICPICEKPKYIALATKYRTNAKGEFESIINIPKKFVDSPDLCDNCVKNFKEENKFVIFKADYKTKIRNNFTKKPVLTGKYLIMNFEIIDRSAPFYDFINEKRFILTTPVEFNNIKQKGKQKCQTES